MKKLDGVDGVVGLSINREIIIHPDPKIDPYSVLAGSSYNVSRWLLSFGFNPLLLGLIGPDEEGQLVSKMLQEKQINTLLFPYRDKTSLAIINLGDGKEKKSTLKSYKYGCQITQQMVEDLRSKLETQFQSKSRYRIATGVIPSELPFVKTFLQGEGVKVLSPRKEFFEMGKGRVNSFLQEVQIDFLATSREVIAPYFGIDSSEIKVGFEHFEPFHNLGVKLMLITCDHKGALISDRSSEIGYSLQVSAPLSEKEVIDSTGAGDAFLAGVLIGQLKNKDPFRTARLCFEMAKITCLKPGGSPKLRESELLSLRQFIE